MKSKTQEKRMSAARRAYKAEIAQLDADVREEAMRRVELLTGQGYQEPRAMCMAITLANEWADNGKTDEGALPGPSQHVMYEQTEGWIICAENGKQSTGAYDRFEDALMRAHELATRYHSAVYVYDLNDHLIDKYEGYGGDMDAGYHVLPWKSGWAIKLTGEDGDFERFDTKREALDAARPRAQADETVLVVHYQDGRVQRSTDYHTN